MKVNKKELVKILSLLKPGLAQKGIIEQSQHFIFTGKDIITYNDQICISHPFETDFAFSVPAAEFLKVLSGISEEEITITTSKEKEKFIFIIKTKATSAGFTSKVDDKALELAKEVIEKKIRFTKLPDQFKESVELCVFSASKDFTVPHLTGVYIDKENVFGSDDFRISHYLLNEEFKDSFIIPAESVLGMKDFEFVRYAIKDGWSYFKTKDNILFCSRLIEGSYSDDPLEYFEFKGDRIKFPSDLKTIVENASVMAEGDFDTDKKVYIKIGDGRISCKGENDKGWVESFLDMKSRKEINFTINPIFLTQILHKTDFVLVGEDRILFKSDNFKHLVQLFE